MRRSFRRLVAGSVLATLCVGSAILFAWANTLSWVEDRAQGDGVYLFYAMLDETEPAQRATRLAELQTHTSVPLELLEVDEVERHLGRPLQPGEQASSRKRFVGERLFIVLHDGSAAFSAGPVLPVAPNYFPFGLIVIFIALPSVAGAIALRFEHAVSKVERVSEALAVGELSARVETGGPSDELATKFNAMAERVERLVRRRDELVQAVSHELGSPLARLRFHMELLGNLSDGQREDRLLAMTRELDALEDLGGELLSYVQSDDTAIAPASFDPTRGLGDLAELATLEGPEESAVDIRTVVPDDVRVFADQRLFMRAVENVLRNAVRYARQSVRIDVHADADKVRVSVHDDGPGIPEDLRTKVVIPFYRPDKDRGRKTGGVGLGLAIANRILLRHGGELEIGDSPLGGAMVSTTWPARPSRLEPL